LVTVEANKASLAVTVIAVLIATLLALFAGLVDEAVGAVVSVAVRGADVAGVVELPPPQAASDKTAQASSAWPKREILKLANMKFSFI
jgi:hypothetical protein